MQTVTKHSCVVDHPLLVTRVTKIKLFIHTYTHTFGTISHSHSSRHHHLIMHKIILYPSHSQVPTQRVKILYWTNNVYLWSIPSFHSLTIHVNTLVTLTHIDVYIINYRGRPFVRFLCKLELNVRMIYDYFRIWIVPASHSVYKNTGRKTRPHN